MNVSLGVKKVDIHSSSIQLEILSRRSGIPKVALLDASIENPGPFEAAAQAVLDYDRKDPNIEPHIMSFFVLALWSATLWAHGAEAKCEDMMRSASNMLNEADAALKKQGVVRP